MNGKRYKFDGYSEPSGNYADIFIGDTNNFTRINSCIHISIPITKQAYGSRIANLNDLNSRPKCSVDNELEQGKDGTDIMVQGVLKYIIQEYPFIETVELTDVARKNGTKILLTPKRLLLGKEGWYEERFGAIPDKATNNFIKHTLPKLRKNIDIEKISKLTWGTYEDLDTISKYLTIPTKWYISKNTINNYPVKINVEYIDYQTAGGLQLKPWIKNIIRRLRNHKLRINKNKIG